MTPVIATAHSDLLATIRKLARVQTLTVLCSDRRISKRIRGLIDLADARWIWVLSMADRAEVEKLDRDDPALQTHAWYERLGNPGVRLLLPLFPSLSPASARRLTERMVRLSMPAERL